MTKEIVPSRTKSPYCPRPSSITTLALFELAGAIGCLALLFLTPAGSRDYIALSIAAAIGFLVVYSLWTLQRWAFWLTAAYESLEIVYELFLLTQPAYHNLHLLGPIFGILLSVLTLAYLFLDPALRKPQSP